MLPLLMSSIVDLYLAELLSSLYTFYILLKHSPHVPALLRPRCMIRRSKLVKGASASVGELAEEHG